MAAKIDIDIIGHDKVSGVLNNIKGALGNVFGVAAGVLTSRAVEEVFGGIVNFGKSVVGEATTSQDAMAQLQSVLKSTGGTAGVSAEMAGKLADSMANLTRFDDEAAISAETVLLQFTRINKDAFPDALSLSADLATRMGTDLPQAAQTIGKALGDPAEGIGRLNMQFRLFNDEELDAVTSMAKAGDVAGAQAIIMDRLREKIGGAAEAAGDTFGGKMDILKHQLDNVKESIGLKLLPILTKFVDKITTWLAAGGADQIAEWAGKFIDWIGELVGWFGNLGSTLSGAQGWFGGIIAWIQEAAAAIGPFVNEILGKFAAWFAENGPLIQTYLQKMGEMFARLAPVVVAMWNVISPILLGIIDAILGLVTFVMQIATGDWAGAWETIKGIVVNIGQAIYNALVGLGGLIVAAITAFMAQASAVWGTIWEGLKNTVTNIFNGIVNFVREKITAIVGAFSGIVTAIQGVIAWIGNLATAFANLILPDWLTPGSPTPFELGLRGINDAMTKLAGTTLPSLSMGFAGMAPALATAGAPAISAPVPTNERPPINITINGNFRNINDLDYLAQEVARRIT